MITFFTTLLGFGSSFVPKVLDYFQDKSDKAHELEMLDKVQEGKVAEAQVVGESNEIVAAHKEQAATVRKASRWLANLSGSIRPVVTYLFVIEFLAINGSIAYLVLSGEGFTIENLRSLLDEEFMGLLGAMIAFWFGSREIRRRENNL